MPQVDRDSLVLYVDVSHCNLRCAMCPRGGLSGLRNTGRGLMSFELFQRIIDKSIEEKAKIVGLIVGNWGEPLLNVDLPKMIGYFKSKYPQSRVMVTSNLNHLENPEELLESGLNTFRISISGMTQNIYSRNHRGGNIERVLANLLTLVEIRNRKNLKVIRFDLHFLEYLYEHHLKEFHHYL